MSDEPANPPPLNHLFPYLSVDGAMEAAAFYAAAFGAEQVSAVPPDANGRTMNIHLAIKGSSLMLADFFPEHGDAPVPPQGFTLHLATQSVDADYARAVAAGATPVLPPRDAFWGDRYAQVKDPKGFIWAFVGR